VISANPAFNAETLWNAAIDQAWKLPRNRSSLVSPGERLQHLKESMDGELVSFHKNLIVQPQPGADDRWKRWHVGIPVTLFPKRDHGFARVECVVELAGEDGSFRVIEAMPKGSSRGFAEASIGGEIQVEASGKAGLPKTMPEGTPLAAASAKIYGSAKSNLRYSFSRAVVISEVVGGTGARWRLDNSSEPEMVGTESHQFGITLETQGAPRISGAGYLKAYSEVQWLTSTVGALLSNLSDGFRRFIGAGAPSEAYGEWSAILG